MREIFKPEFARMPTSDFVEHLQNYGIEPTPEEMQPIREEGTTLRHGIEETIFDSTGQRFGEPGNGFSSE